MNLSLEELSEGMRLGPYNGLSLSVQLVINRLLDVGTALVERQTLTDCPAAVQNEAVVRLAAYLFDQPHAGSRMSYAAAWRSSGAAAVCAPWLPVDALSVDVEVSA